MQWNKFLQEKLRFGHIKKLVHIGVISFTKFPKINNFFLNVKY